MTNLDYLSEGRGRINSGGQDFGTADSGLLGEMNVLVEGPASAQVRVEGGHDRGACRVVSSITPPPAPAPHAGASLPICLSMPISRAG